MILTQEEIDVIDQSMCGERECITPFVRAIEQAVIAKLSQGVDMSKPYSLVNDELVYSFDQVEVFVAASRIKALQDAARVSKAWERKDQVSKASIAILALKGELK